MIDIERSLLLEIAAAALLSADSARAARLGPMIDAVAALPDVSDLLFKKIDNPPIFLPDYTAAEWHAYIRRRNDRKARELELGMSG